MPLTYCDVFAFLWRSFLTMGCFFDCFRVRPNQSLSQSSTKDEVGQKIRLSSLFSAEDKEECITAMKENVDEELLEEARFLKACGTLQGTPTEIRKAVSFAANLEKSDKGRPDSMVDSSLKTLNANQEAQPQSEQLEGSGLCVTQSVIESSPETPVHIQNPKTAVINLVESDLQRTGRVHNPSPYPTPRNIPDDMQTPGTAFATDMTNIAKGNVRIRSQYVHTTLQPSQNQTHQQELKQENDFMQENLSEQKIATPSSAVPSGGDSSKDEGNKIEASLSSWLKPPLNDAANNRKPNTKRILGDRPIIGLVGTHWKEEEETTHNIPPKWWDGNGIPNSTTKYKEDQKVCWHATPFEERLEKALSEESTVSQRKPITGAPIMFEDIEGHDTATSQLQPVNCAKSVVSF